MPCHSRDIPERITRFGWNSWQKLRRPGLGLIAESARAERLLFQERPILEELGTVEESALPSGARCG